MGFLVMAGQLLLAISILVGLHEGGHMLAAKLFGMRVEKFSIGFPPKLIGFQQGETYYMLGMIPLGGFVKISGMMDESMDKDQLKKPPEPHEFRSKPAWQRLIVMLAGILVNVISGIIIFILLLNLMGETYVDGNEAKEGVWVGSIGQQIGLKTGDKILNVNGEGFTKFRDLRSVEVLLEKDNSYYTVQRGDSVFKVTLPPDFLEKLSDGKDNDQFFIRPMFTFDVGKVVKGTGAAKAGLQPGDSIVAVDGRQVRYFHELKQVLSEKKNRRVQIKVKRDQNVLSKKAKVDSAGHLGFRPTQGGVNFDTLTYSFARAIPEGTHMAFEKVWIQVLAFKKIFSGELDPRKSMGGPIAIAEQYGSVWHWGHFWEMTAFISMVLAFMNILPIPALDGGHVMFLLFEMVAGRKPGDKFMENAQKVGMIFLLTLMALVLFNDVLRQAF